MPEQLANPKNQLHSSMGVSILSKSPMSKLFKLKQWLTLPEAVKHLSGICGEEVTQADILRLGLDKHIKLSVYFVNKTRAKPGTVVYFDENRFSDLTKDSLPEELQWTYLPISEEIALTSLRICKNKFLNLKKNEVVTIEGVWDLPMLGWDALDIEHLWQQLTGGPEVTLQCLEGAFVEKDDMIYQLQESFDQNEFHAGSKAQLEHLKRVIVVEKIDSETAEKMIKQHQEERKKYLERRTSNNCADDYYPAASLPVDSILVVRTDALRAFEQLISDVDPNKTTSTKPHGNTEINAQKREHILGAALSVLANWPEQCKNGSGEIEATKIRKQIEEKALLFWKETGEPPLSTEKIEREIRKWLNTVK